jgi:hypothetical protein
LKGRIPAAVLILLVYSFCALGGQRPLTPLNVANEFSPRLSVLDTPYSVLIDDDHHAYSGFKFPDAFGDDWRNQTFQAPTNCTISAVMLVFPTHHGQTWTTGAPTLIVRVWRSAADTLIDHSVAYLPDVQQVLLTDTLPFDSFSSSLFQTDSVWRDSLSQFAFVDVRQFAVQLNGFDRFNVGYSAIVHGPQDSLAIMADDGYPETNNASEFSHGQFVPMRVNWPGVSFFIRVIVDLGATGTGVLRPGSMADNFELQPAFPNPFNATTTLPFTIKRAGRVNLTVFDVLGRERAELWNGVLPAGAHASVVNGLDWSSGVYYARLQSGEGTRTIRMVLEK